MYTFVFKRKLNIPGKKVVFLLLLLAGLRATAQQNNPLYDYQKSHFGFILGLSQCRFKVNLSDNFYKIDSLTSVHYQPFQGFQLGGLANLRLGKYWDARGMFCISFAQRNLLYSFKNKGTQNLKIESTYMDFPLLIKYKSERLRNVRFYALGGFQYSYDLSSQKGSQRSSSDPVVALEKNNYCYVVGFGFDLYYPYFKFSPEIKLITNFNNSMVKDEYVYTKALNGIYPRIISLAFTFE